jgi:hypothetical protein
MNQEEKKLILNLLEKLNQELQTDNFDSLKTRRIFLNFSHVFEEQNIIMGDCIVQEQDRNYVKKSLINLYDVILTDNKTDLSDIEKEVTALRKLIFNTDKTQTRF